MRPGALLLGAALVLPSVLSAQGMPEFRVEREDHSVDLVPVALDRGYASVDVDVLTTLGWRVAAAGDVVTISLPSAIGVSLRMGSPFVRWDDAVLQLADAPYRDGAQAFVPLQLLTDVLPERLPTWYEFDAATATLKAGVPGTQQAGTPPEPDLTRPSAYDGVRVVVIDAGHGGADPGALGPQGIREKNVALGIAVELARILREKPGIEVHMTRDDDTFVDVWDRGQIATDVKGERPGVFVSVHANSFPTSRTTQGFETYFLSEARTEHERRVSANENAPLSFGGQGVSAESQPDLDFIMRELRNLEHQHWSALLAEIVQDEIGGFHPGPNRGVKQGVLAVLTNALMPSVLVEVGYLSNPDEGRLMGRSDFQERASEAIARAVLRFFERYPPGSGTGGSGGGG